MLHWYDMWKSSLRDCGEFVSTYHAMVSHRDIYCHTYIIHSQLQFEVAAPQYRPVETKKAEMCLGILETLSTVTVLFCFTSPWYNVLTMFSLSVSLGSGGGGDFNPSTADIQNHIMAASNYSNSPHNGWATHGVGGGGPGPLTAAVNASLSPHHGLQWVTFIQQHTGMGGAS